MDVETEGNRDGEKYLYPSDFPILWVRGKWTTSRTEIAIGKNRFNLQISTSFGLHPSLGSRKMDLEPEGNRDREKYLQPSLFRVSPIGEG